MVILSTQNFNLITYSEYSMPDIFSWQLLNVEVEFHNNWEPLNNSKWKIYLCYLQIVFLGMWGDRVDYHLFGFMVSTVKRFIM